MHYAACLGDPEIITILVNVKHINLNIIDEETGVNAFWLAAFYGRGQACSILAEKGIDIMNKHSGTNSNALHIAIERKHYKLANMLINSQFPVNEEKVGGISPLDLACTDHKAYEVAI